MPTGSPQHSVGTSVQPQDCATHHKDIHSLETKLQESERKREEEGKHHEDEILKLNEKHKAEIEALKIKNVAQVNYLWNFWTRFDVVQMVHVRLQCTYTLGVGKAGRCFETNSVGTQEKASCKIFININKYVSSCYWCTYKRNI